LKLISPYLTPDSGWVARGAISFSVSATSTLPISKVEFYIDNALLSTDLIYPYSYLWNTRNYSVGAHTLKAIAYDAQGSSTVSQAVNVKAALVLKTTTKAAVTAGLIPNITALIPNVSLRDVSICVGADNAYYLTGAMSDNSIYYHNEGVNLWRSLDLKNWTYIGLVWSFENDATSADKTWNLFYDQQFRAIWNTKIHYLEGNYYISFGNPVIGSRLLKSATGKAEGPYINVALETDLTKTTIFNDSINKYKVYYELMNCGFLFKTNGKYYLSTTNTMISTNRFSSYVGIADSLTGKFHDWHEALPCGGNASYFADTQGGLWATIFGNDDAAPWRERAGIVKMTVDASGKLKVSTDQTLPTPTISGLNDNKNEVGDFKLYPNPANNFLMIENTENAIVSIIDISGKTIQKIKCAERITKLDVSTFANGLYLIKIENNQISKTQKISINH
ncbi:MAG: T9SS type A sorting domain-containing protein, partial [Paludibacter sp.]